MGVGLLDHHLQCPTRQVTMVESLTRRNQALNSGKTKTSSLQNPLIASKQASILIIPCLVVARCSFESVFSDISSDFMPLSQL